MTQELNEGRLKRSHYFAYNTVDGVDGMEDLGYLRVVTDRQVAAALTKAEEGIKGEST